MVVVLPILTERRRQHQEPELFREDDGDEDNTSKVF